MFPVDIQQCDYEKILQYRHEDQQQKNSVGMEKLTKAHYCLRRDMGNLVATL